MADTNRELGWTLLRDGGEVDPDTGEPTASDDRLKAIGAMMQQAADHLTRLSQDTGFKFERIITTMIETGMLDDERFSDFKYFTKEKWNHERFG